MALWFSHIDNITQIPLSGSILFTFWLFRISYKPVPAHFLNLQRENQSKEQTDLNRNSIERLNHALDRDFHWKPAKSKLKPYAASCYDAVVTRYEAYLIQTGKTITNTRHHIHLIADFLSHMESAEITSVLNALYSNKPPCLISHRTALTSIDDQVIRNPPASGSLLVTTVTTSPHSVALPMKNYPAEFHWI